MLRFGAARKTVRGGGDQAGAQGYSIERAPPGGTVWAYTMHDSSQGCNSSSIPLYRPGGIEITSTYDRRFSRRGARATLFWQSQSAVWSVGPWT
jgi:hypothetical protein